MVCFFFFFLDKIKRRAYDIKYYIILKKIYVK